MIELAIRHPDALREKWQATVLDQSLRWYHLTYHQLVPELETSTWDRLQMVSLFDGNVIGYLSAKFDRSTQSVDSAGIVHFPTSLDDDNTLTFANDLLTFVGVLFNQFGARHIRWSAAVENPATRFYTMLVDRCGARIVGVLHGSLSTADGEICDEVIYQMTRGDYQASRGGTDG